MCVCVCVCEESLNPDLMVYRGVQLNFTPEIELFYMLFEIFVIIFSMASLK